MLPTLPQGLKRRRFATEIPWARGPSLEREIGICANSTHTDMHPTCAHQQDVVVERVRAVDEGRAFIQINVARPLAARDEILALRAFKKEVVAIKINLPVAKYFPVVAQQAAQA